MIVTGPAEFIELKFLHLYPDHWAFADLLVKAAVTKAELVAATDKVPEHCQVDGEINRRIGINGQSYAMRFRLAGMGLDAEARN